MAELDQLQEIIKCKQSFVYFCKNYIKIYHPVKGLIDFNLYGYQEKKVYPAIKNNRFSIFRKFRQCGLTTLSAIYAFWKTLFEVDHKTLLVSKSDREAAIIMEMIQLAWNNLPEWMKCKTLAFNKHQIALETGSSINCYTPRAGRSFAISLLIVDEAAFIDNMETIWKGLFPVISTGGSVIIVSTVNGFGNWYYGTYQDAVDGLNDFYAVHLHYTDHPEYRTEEWVEMMRRQLGPKGFAQEVLGEFIGSDDTYIDGETLKLLERETTDPISKMHDNKLWIWKKPIKGRHYILAADTAEGLGENQDFSTFHIIDSKSLEQVAEFCSNTTRIGNFAKIIYETAKYYNKAIVVCEVVGNTLSVALLDKIYDEYGYDNVYWSKTGKRGTRMGFIMSPKTRPLVLQHLSACIFNKTVKINSSRLIHELNTFVYNARQHRPEARKGRHDDLIMAIGIGLYVRDSIVESFIEDEDIISNQSEYVRISDIFVENEDDEIKKEFMQSLENENDDNVINVNSYIQTNRNIDDDEESLLQEFGWL